MLIEVTLREIFGMRAAVLDAWTDAVFDDELGASKLCERLMDDFQVRVGCEFPAPNSPRLLEIDDLSLDVVARSLKHAGTWMREGDMQVLLGLFEAEWKELVAYIDSCQRDAKQWQRWPDNELPALHDPANPQVGDVKQVITYGHSSWVGPRDPSWVKPEVWMQMMVSSLERLTAPADGQIEYLTTLGSDDVDELGLAFQDAYVRFTRGFSRDRSPAVVDACAEVDKALRSLDLGWSFADLESPAWAKIRVLAARAAKALCCYQALRESQS
ncbi:MAG: hypothetical protein QM705_07415 [Ancrocorticia sp.]